jgi:outer membrane lipoprotein SlyB
MSDRISNPQRLDARYVSMVSSRRSHGVSHRTAPGTSPYEIKGEEEGSQTAKKLIGGAGSRVLIGGIAGGGTGAAIGVAAGAVTGTAIAGSKKQEQLAIPSESLIEFRLQQPVWLPVAR